MISAQLSKSTEKVAVAGAIWDNFKEVALDLNPVKLKLFICHNSFLLHHVNSIT